MLRTIKGKFIVGFFLIFSLSFLVLNHTVKNVIWSSNENIVTSDLVELKKKQYRVCKPSIFNQSL